ncbi:MAG: universal stress protein [Rhodospirillaceae bacterium]|nr:universal stress protein [Rhodospirillaceae bacterium]
MVGTDIDLDQILENRKERYRVLVCIDGTKESYRGLSYAADAAASNPKSDIVLLYVRPIDQGLRSGGLQVRVARENMLSWGLELPGIKYLKQGLEQLIAGDALSADWNEKITHTDVDGDPLGDNKIEYTNQVGQTIVLKLKTASTIASGILDQYQLGPYDLIILGDEGSWGGWAKSFWDPAVAEKVSMHASCSVLVARSLERGHGHLLCTDGSERAMAMVKRSAIVSKRIGSRLSVLSVARDTEGEEEAWTFVNQAVNELKSNGVDVVDSFVRVGNPFEEIIDAGEKYSCIVVGSSGNTSLKRFFLGSVAFKVMEHATNSVIIAR